MGMAKNLGINFYTRINLGINFLDQNRKWAWQKI
jgi:hypothetical protein